MENRKLVLSLLIVLFLLSGCTNGDTTQSTGSKAISVTGPELSRSKIYSGSTVTARLGLKNTGELNATLIVGNGIGKVKGKRVLTDYCRPIFKIQNFVVRTSAEARDGGEAYRLRPGQEIELVWQLKQYSGNVPLNGYKCPLKFTASFNYTVQAFRQIQIKKNPDVGGHPSLTSKSSEGPLKIQIETIGSSSERGAPVFIKGDSIKVLVRWINRNVKESAYRGIIEINNADISVSAGDLGQGCNIEDSIILYRGKSQVIQCSYDPEVNDAISVIREISAQADYKYIKDIGSRQVRVMYGGK
ncbi:MAG: hypothetical protein ABEJ75_04375 [Candidatus Nanohaloarchaea archaeon]